MRGPRIFVLAVGSFLLAGCLLFDPTSVPCGDPAESSAPSPLADTAQGTSWVYQLQSADPYAIAASDFDIAVIDVSYDGSDEGAYDTDDLDTIRSSGPGTVLAYLSIGEAEEYRGYFDPSWIRFVTGQPGRDAPCWLGRTNPEWKGNYKVQYWSSSWQEIVLTAVDGIVEEGFNGVYLDIIDAYEYWSDNGNREGFVISERTAADRMINLVLAIANRARAVDPGFLVFPQNGAPILAFDDGMGAFEAGAYLDAISGIGIEDLYFDETSSKSQAEIDERLPFLRSIRDSGKTVLVTNYVDDGTDTAANTDRIDEFRARAEEEGFVPYPAIADRALDEING